MKPPRKSTKESVVTRRAPELADDLLTTPQTTGLLGSREVSIADCRLESVEARGRNFGSIRIERALLERVSLPECECGSMALKDVRLVGCDLANMATRGLSLTRVEFVNCRMTGFRGGEANCQDVLIFEGDQKYSQFRYSKFKGAEFESCNFEEADLQGADLSGCVFRRCNLRNADLLNAKLWKADLRGSGIEGMTVSPEGLRGAVVDPSQAMVFALLLGIRIE